MVRHESIPIVDTALMFSLFCFRLSRSPAGSLFVLIEIQQANTNESWSNWARCGPSKGVERFNDSKPAHVSDAPVCNDIGVIGEGERIYNVS